MIIFALAACEPEIIITKTQKPRECIAEVAPLYYPGFMEHGRTTGLKNCLPFQASTVADFNSDSNQITLQMTTFDDAYIFEGLKESFHITIDIDFARLGYFIDTLLQPTQQSYQLHNMPGLPHDVFDFDQQYEFNKLIFTDIDLTSKRIQGRFESGFVLNTPSPNPMLPDTIIFWDCHFDASDPF